MLKSKEKIYIYGTGALSRTAAEIIESKKDKEEQENSLSNIKELSKSNIEKLKNNDVNNKTATIIKVIPNISETLLIAKSRVLSVISFIFILI